MKCRRVVIPIQAPLSLFLHLIPLSSSSACQKQQAAGEYQTAESVQTHILPLNS